MSSNIFGVGRDSQLHVVTRASMLLERAAIVQVHTSLTQFSTTNRELMKFFKRKPKFSQNLIKINKDIPCYIDKGNLWRLDNELSEEQRIIFDLVLR